MGQTPKFVAAAKPEAFLFENVPGLLEGENQEYFAFLIDSLRHPAADLSYSVLAAVFNAADFGAPQMRSRLFIVGLRERTTRDVSDIFDRIKASAKYDSTRWPTLKTILTREKDAPGWMRWPYGQLRGKKIGRIG
jgi:site-specific DNA-cytosine methylase